MAKKFSIPTGLSDFMPEDHRYFDLIKRAANHRFRQAGCSRISPPLFEETELFAKTLGENSEIFANELYSFISKNGKSYSLRPEVTSGIIRSFIEIYDKKQSLPTEFFYIERCFRHERPKANTKRQFWQVGAEIIGERDPSIVAQLIYIGHQILLDLDLRDKCILKISTLGEKSDRAVYFEALENFYKGKEANLSPKSLENLQNKRYLKLLEPQNEDEEILLDMAPKINEFLSKDSKESFTMLLEYLDTFDIEYEIDYCLTRPLHYYSGAIFEFQSKSRNEKILVGGCYNNLVENLGGPSIGGCGFAMGVERSIRMMQDQDTYVPDKSSIQIFVAATGVLAKKSALPLLIKLRQHGFSAIGVLGKASITEQLNRANKFKATYVLVVGDKEIKDGKVIIRTIKTGKQEWIEVGDLLPRLEELLGKPNFH